MQVIFFSTSYTTEFNCDIMNLMQLMDFCKANKPELYTKLYAESFTYTVYKEGAEQAFPIRPELVQNSIEEYDLLVIAPKLEGGVSLIAVGIFAAVGTTAAAASFWTAVAVYAAAVVITVGIVVALGYLMQALSPNKKLDGNTDPSEASRIFNGVPNITEQGGSVPVVIGNCLFGGVRIGLKFEVAQTSYADIRTVASFAEAMTYPSSWLKIV